MSVKRKSSTTMATQPKPKAAKISKSSTKPSKPAQKPSKKSKYEASDVSGEDDEFEGFRSSEEDDDMDENDMDSAAENDSNEEDDLDDGSEEMEIDEDSTKNSKPAKQIASGTLKEGQSHAAQRALAKERKLQRPNANKLHEAKKLWESLRLQKQSKSDRQTQVDQLFKLISGDIPSLVFGHSASRFVQTAMKYGSPDQRMAIAKELQGRYVELSKAKYGKFLVGKILEYGNAEVRNLVVGEFFGNVGKLISHKEAGMVANDIYRDICTPSQKLEFLQELYGPEFRLFKSENGLSLKQILAEKPEKKEMISKNLIEMVKNCMKKDIINLDLVHTALLQALEISSLKDIQELVSLFQEQIQQLVHTKDGARAACLLLSDGTAKNRKAMIKSIREIIPQMAIDQYGHMVLIVLCAVVDDTKLVSKAVLAQLQGQWHNLIRNKWGRKVVLFLCREDQDVLVKECREKSVNTSKKDNQIRRQELLEFVSEDLLSVVSSEAYEVMTDPLAIQVAQEILLSGRGDKSKAISAVITLASGDPSQESHIIKLPYTSRVYKTLVQGGHYNSKEKKIEFVDPPLDFANKLYEVILPNLEKWAIGEGSFVVVSLLEGLLGDRRDEMISQLKKVQKFLKSRGGDNKGTKIVLEKIA